MLTKRIIPCLDVKDGRVVKGVKFEDLKDAGDPVENAVYYDKAGADELVFLDITASSDKRDIILDVVKRVAESIFMPFTVGGGVRNIDDIRALLNAGADKVSINTAAVKNPGLIKETSQRFGSQCIVVAIDAKLIPNTQYPIHNTKHWEVYVNGGRTSTGIDVIDWVKKAEGLGAGEVLLTSMDCDGTKDGYDTELTRAVSRAVNIAVIASGGAGRLEHFYEVLADAGADAALAASLFHYREFSVKEVKDYLIKRGASIRI
ncbi:MAG: imidazole glycerol phosphate synthase subunit HisF [Candidatus Omnitrophica bacterium CG11_big_fil_rev_8_21_14_0_20_42_13]|uniref:Imidazole glycerol phosphate synthase subunit HisF n=1 Tax=Candidatus Ghiorseimicrobium undicola TaxID=1974746 RepID=A0A2H0LVL9_9BACT|nr:MAG: imidazole glycerol phosphate synthase subunit HisF [Candidatus Omnitrophica bacterium CG11_big_fil_rev_8_21_14_0_20_42_13]